MQRAHLLLVPAAFLAGCGGLIGVEPLFGDDAGVDAGTVDALTADAAPEASIPDASPVEASPCTAVWVDASGGYVPPGAVNAEPIDAQTVTIYVCRTPSGSDLVPGKLRPNYGCYHGDGDAEVFSLDYEVLVPAGCTVGWGAAPDGVTPANAVVCGQDSQGDLYSCRVTEPAMDQGELGHMGWGTNHECIYSLSGLSLTSTAFDVLTLQ
jgi:hypothetical protein